MLMQMSPDTDRLPLSVEELPSPSSHQLAISIIFHSHRHLTDMPNFNWIPESS